MNRRRKIAIICFVCVFLSATCVYGLATNDALITEGYLNEVFFPKVKEYINQVVSQNPGTDQPGTSPGSSEIFTVVSVKEGQNFYGKEGCEFILRQGGGTVIASELGGLTDVTSGVDLGNGQDVPPNHLLIVPRNDSRGFTAARDVLIMVKGGYLIEQK